MKTNGFILEGKALEKANRRFLIRFLGKEYYNWCFMDKLNYRRVSLIEMRYMVDLLLLLFKNREHARNWLLIYNFRFNDTPICMLRDRKDLCPIEEIIKVIHEMLEKAVLEKGIGQEDLEPFIRLFGVKRLADILGVSLRSISSRHLKGADAVRFLDLKFLIDLSLTEFLQERFVRDWFFCCPDVFLNDSLPVSLLRRKNFQDFWKVAGAIYQHIAGSYA